MSTDYAADHDNVLTVPVLLNLPAETWRRIQRNEQAHRVHPDSPDDPGMLFADAVAEFVKSTKSEIKSNTSQSKEILALFE